MESPTLQNAEKIRSVAIRTTSEEHRHALAQHLTPPQVAKLAASMFSDASEPISLMDLGAGTGILTVAVMERYHELLTRADAIEVDPLLADVYQREVRPFIDGKLVRADAISLGEYEKAGLLPTYSRIILNPPYKKMAASDPRQADLPARSPNLYSAFVMRSIEHLSDGGEVVAVIPRSWTNGEYFAPFRRWLFERCSLDSIHVYGSRGEVFEDTDVLQETVIAKFSRRRQSPQIVISMSDYKSDIPEKRAYPAKALILGKDKVVRVAPPETGGMEKTVKENGFCASTGKVVDFRSRDYILLEKPDDQLSVPLIYVGNFVDGKLVHPLPSLGKGQWFIEKDEWAGKQVLPAGAYVVVRRFSAKEERRRVVAYPLIADVPVALENHSSYIHAGTPRHTVPLQSPELAYGLAIWLNSTLVDQWFRGVSGSTQVNARDIKEMPCPDSMALESLGRRWHPAMSQDEIDQICREMGRE